MANIQQRPRSLPACDLCHEKKVRCDRNDPCSNCVDVKSVCTRLRPRQNANAKRTEQIDGVLERMGKLEDLLSRQFSSNANSNPSPLSPASTDLLADRRASTSKGTQKYPSSVTGLSDDVLEMSPFSGTQQGPAATIASISPVASASASSTRSVPSVPSVRRNDGIGDLLEHRLNKRARKSQPQPEPQPQPQPVVHEQSEIDELEEQGQTPENRTLATLDLNRYLKPTRPQKNRTLEAERQQVLEKAIKRAKQGINEPGLRTLVDHRINFYEPSMYPSVEFLYWFRREYTNDPMVKYFMDAFSCIPPEVLEDYVLSLINCVVHDQRRLQFIICANQVAYAFLTCLESSKSPAIEKQLSRSKESYQNNLVTAFHHFDTRPRADVPLLFALQSAALIMQDTGNMRRCWKLNTLACEVASLLQQCSPSDLDVETGCMSALRLAYVRCFIFDTALSAHLYQPASLKISQWEDDVSTTDQYGTEMLRTLLDIARVSEVIIRETKKCAAPHQMGQLDISRIASLKDTMNRIHHHIRQMRSSADVKKDEYLSFEWLTMDCIYYSMMVTIIRLSSPNNDHLGHEECLENSRKCLITLKALLDIVSRTARPYRFLSSLAWVVPLFPLRPIYFVFSNVIESLDVLDLKILQDLATRLDGPGKSHYSIMEVQRLCASLVELYTQFSEKAVYSRRPVGRDDDLALATAQNSSWNHALVDTADSHFGNDIAADTFSQFDQDILTNQDFLLDMPFCQQVDWELFCAQSDLE